MLIKNNPLPLENNLKFTTLLEATRMNSNVGLAHAILMVRPGVKFEQDENGRSPLSWAASNGWVEIIRSIVWLESRISSDQRDTSGRTSLSYAAQAELSGAAVQILVESGANPNSEDKFMRTPLSYAATIEI
jgi:ankyrin repeat protein